MRIAVLGCGPSGLMVAHAVRLAGHEPVIMSDRIEPSATGGCMYLHQAVPELTEEGVPFADVQIMKLGLREGYALKVYNDINHEISWDQFDGTVEAYSFPAAYEKLWDQYLPNIYDVGRLGPKEIEYLYHNEYPVIFSTIPLKALAQPEDEFVPISQEVWVTKPLRVLGKEDVSYAMNDENFRTIHIRNNTIVYNGIPEHPWYRMTYIFGAWSVEYPYKADRPEPTHAVRVHKPLRWLGKEPLPYVFKFGRYGKWKKGELIHHAFEQALKIAMQF